MFIARSRPNGRNPLPPLPPVRSRRFDCDCAVCVCVCVEAAGGSRFSIDIFGPQSNRQTHTHTHTHDYWHDDRSAARHSHHNNNALAVIKAFIRTDRVLFALNEIHSMRTQLFARVRFSGSHRTQVRHESDTYVVRRAPRDLLVSAAALASRIRGTH